jgi:hypothetical protein
MQGYFISGYGSLPHPPYPVAPLADKTYGHLLRLDRGVP